MPTEILILWKLDNTKTWESHNKRTNGYQRCIMYTSLCEETAWCCSMVMTYKVKWCKVSGREHKESCQSRGIGGLDSWIPWIGRSSSFKPTLGRYKIPWQFCGIWTIKKERNYDKIEIKKRPISCHDKEYFEAVDLCIRCCLCGLAGGYLLWDHQNTMSLKRIVWNTFSCGFHQFWRETRRIR